VSRLMPRHRPAIAGCAAPPLDRAGAAGRIESLEADIRYLSESFESLSEETRFVRSLLESPASESDSIGLLEPDDVPDRDS